uniref:RRM domain-containing protein n=1 Tax=Pundamilia nyererei TaxID=303518 RepID=A0A3B4FEL1_9CICH
SKDKSGATKEGADKGRGRDKNRTRRSSSSGSSSGSSSSASSHSGSSSSRSSSSSSSSSSPSPSRQRHNNRRRSRSKYGSVVHCLFSECDCRSKSPKKEGRDRRRRSPTPKPTKVFLGRLTRNVIKEHIQEIFSTYGKIKMIEMPMNRMHPHLSKGYAYVEYETSEEAEKALKHMDGGNHCHSCADSHGAPPSSQAFPSPEDASSAPDVAPDSTSYEEKVMSK